MKHTRSRLEEDKIVRTETMHHKQALSSIGSVARVMALPADSSPTRYPSFPALERTSVLSFKSQGTYSVASGTTTGFLSRSPVMPLWLDDSRADVYGVGYKMPYVENQLVDGSAVELPLGAPDAFFVGPGTTTNTSRTNFQIVGGTSPRLGFPVMASSNVGAPYIWVPKGYIVIMAMRTNEIAAGAVAPDTNRLQIGIERWSNPGETVSLNIPIYSDTADIAGGTVFRGAFYGDSFSYGTDPSRSAANGFWFRPNSWQVLNFTSCLIGASTDFVVFVAPKGTTHSLVNGPVVQIAVGAATLASLPYFPVPEYSVSKLPWASTRLTALSVLMTNVTKVLNKEGTVQAARLNPETEYFMNLEGGVTTDLLASRHPSEKALLGLEEGFYTFSVPSTDLANFWDHTLKVNESYFAPGSINVTGWVPVYRLDNSGLVNAFVITDQDTSTVTSLAINLDMHIEFRTTSTLWPIGLSQMSLEAFHQAQIALVAAGFFFNNRDHGTVMNIIRSIGRTIGGPVMGAVVPAALSAGKVFLDDLSGNIIMPTKTPDTRPTGEIGVELPVLSKSARKRLAAKKKKAAALVPKKASSNKKVTVKKKDRKSVV